MCWRSFFSRQYKLKLNKVRFIICFMRFGCKLLVRRRSGRIVNLACKCFLAKKRKKRLLLRFKAMLLIKALLKKRLAIKHAKITLKIKGITKAVVGHVVLFAFGRAKKKIKNNLSNIFEKKKDILKHCLRVYQRRKRIDYLTGPNGKIVYYIFNFLSIKGQGSGCIQPNGDDYSKAKGPDGFPFNLSCDVMHFVKSKIVVNNESLKKQNSNNIRRIQNKVSAMNNLPVETASGLLNLRKNMGGLVHQQVNYKHHEVFTKFQMDNPTSLSKKEELDTIVKSSTLPSLISNENNLLQSPNKYQVHTPIKNSISNFVTLTPSLPLDKRRDSRITRRFSKMTTLNPEISEVEKIPDHIPVELPALFANKIKSIYDLVCLIIDLKHIAKRNVSLVDNVCPVQYSETGEIELIVHTTTPLKTNSRLLNMRTNRGSPRQQNNQNSPRKNNSPIKKNDTTNINNKNSRNNNKKINNNKSIESQKLIVPVPPLIKKINNSFEKKNPKINLTDDIINKDEDLNHINSLAKIIPLPLERLTEVDENENNQQEDSKFNKLPSILNKSNSKGSKDSLDSTLNDDDTETDEDNSDLVSLLTSDSSQHSTHEIDCNDRYAKAEDRINNNKKIKMLSDIIKLKENEEEKEKQDQENNKSNHKGENNRRKSTTNVLKSNANPNLNDKKKNIYNNPQVQKTSNINESNKKELLESNNKDYKNRPKTIQFLPKNK